MSSGNTKSEDVSKSASGLAGIPESIKHTIESVAKGLGVAVTEIWTIFVRQYVVRGLSEAFTAIVCFAATAVFWQQIGFYAFIPFAVGMAFSYGAIAYLGNPKYYALTDITKRIQEATDKNKSSSSYSRY